MNDPIQIGSFRIATDFPELPPSTTPPSAVRRLPSASPFIINTINTHSWVVAETDPVLREALSSSDVLLPDGEGIVWAVRYLTGQQIRKIAGFDIFIHLLQYLQKTSGTCFFMGGSQKTLDLIKARLAKEYPNITAGFYSPPFKQEFSDEDNSIIHTKIRSQFTAHSSPFTVLFVGMTAPKQEKWVHKNKENIHADIICSIGAVFDFYAGTVKRPPDWMIRLKLEWLGRLLSNPKKMWKRVFLSGPRFILSILQLPGKTSNIQHPTSNI
jgi:N-acetylglucosaminyldiphosphoundecaprenol N-acetyl-beta-D-mannosaminyltransferase